MKLILIEANIDNEYNKFYSDIDRETFDALVKLDPKTVVRDGQIVNVGFGAKQLLIAKWKAGDHTILDRGEEITKALETFYANMKNYEPQYRNLGSYKSIDDFISFVNGGEIEAAEIKKENPIDIIYNKYYSKLDRAMFDEIIALDPETKGDKIGEVARDLLLATALKGDTAFLQDHQTKRAIRIFYEDRAKLSSEAAQLKNYTDVNDFIKRMLWGEESDLVAALKNNTEIDPNTHRTVAEDAVIVGSTRDYDIIWEKSHRAAVAVSGGFNSNDGMHWCTGKEPYGSSESDSWYNEYARGRYGIGIVAFMKKGHTRGTENRDFNFQIAFDADGNITEFLNGHDSTPNYNGNNKNERFASFLLANPDIYHAILGKDPFKNCKSIEIASGIMKYEDIPFELKDAKSLKELLSLHEMGIAAVREAIITIDKVPSFAFAGANGLRKVTFGNTVKEIGAAAFANCLSLGRIELPPQLTRIGAGAFSGDGALRGSVRIPDTLTEIGPKAFDGTHVKLSVNKERKTKLKVDINDAEWMKQHLKGILIR